MKNRFYELLLLIATIIFGTSYLFQSISGNLLGPLTVNFLRYAIGTICLLPLVFKKLKKQDKEFFNASFLLGIVLFIAPFLQQLVAPITPVGKMGFISSLYLVFVPLLSYLLFKTKIKKLTLFSVLIAFIGLSLLCDIEGFQIAYTDLALIIVAFAFGFEIIILDIYSKKIDPTVLMFGSFAITALFNLALIPFFEEIQLTNIIQAIPSLIYLGFGSTFIAYTLQAIGQKYVDQIVATLIMSLESVISLLAGYIFFKQLLSTKEIIGCLIVFIGVILCELSTIEKKNPRRDSI